MSIEQMRMAILDVYGSESWEEKVKHMTDNQVIAVYHKFLANGKFDKKADSVNAGESVEKSCENSGGVSVGGSKYEQLSLFDLDI